MSFETSVFINCPFDAGYFPLLRPVLFCVIDLGFEPRIASERLNSSEMRVEKITELIRAARLAIHDLSRLQANEIGELFRLNMAFELGLDVGCRTFGGGKFSEKKCLILEADKHRYRNAISDLSGSDIAAHGNVPEQALTEVRNWLKAESKLEVPGPTGVWGRFNDFMAWNYDKLKLQRYSDRDIENLPVSELLQCMKDWNRTHPLPARPS